MPDAKTVELLFPIGGMDLSREFQLQPGNTTPLGINVQSFDVLEKRNRGGSRSGIRRYIDQKLGLFSLIQHINVIVDPTIEATASEYWTEIWFSRTRSRRMRREKRYIRKGGSGVKGRRQTNQPTCVDDTTTADIGGAAVETFILTNDTYSGTATVTLGAGITNTAGGSVSLLGPVGGWRISYTPPANGAGGTVVIPYRLTATGNNGRDYGKLTITVSSWPPTSFPRTYTARVATVVMGDGYVEITLESSADGLPVGPGTTYKITANGAGTGGGDVDIFINNFAQVENIVVGDDIQIDLSGTFDTGFDGTVTIL